MKKVVKGILIALISIAMLAVFWAYTDYRSHSTEGLWYSNSSPLTSELDAWARAKMEIPNTCQEIQDEADVWFANGGYSQQCGVCKSTNYDQYQKVNCSEIESKNFSHEAYCVEELNSGWIVKVNLWTYYDRSDYVGDNLVTYIFNKDGALMSENHEAVCQL